MIHKAFVLPGFRDLLQAGYEVIGNFVSDFFFERTSLKRARLLVLLASMAAFLIGGNGAGHPLLGSLCAALVPVGIMWVRAVDIARMRQRLYAVAEDPQLREPELDQLRERSATINALWTVARCLTHVRQGEAFVVEPKAKRLYRSLLDRRATRLLDAARAMAAFELGDRKRAVHLAAVAIPVEIAAIDRTVGRILLSDAWQDAARLKALSKPWYETSGALCELARLIELRYMTTTERIDVLNSLDAEVIHRLSDDARAMGDLPLSGALVPPSRHIGPYR